MNELITRVISRESLSLFNGAMKTVVKNPNSVILIIGNNEGYKNILFKNIIQSDQKWKELDFPEVKGIKYYGGGYIIGNNTNGDNFRLMSNLFGDQDSLCSPGYESFSVFLANEEKLPLKHNYSDTDFEEWFKYYLP